MSLMVIISIGAVILFLIGTPIMVVIGLWCIGRPFPRQLGKHDV